MATDNASTNDPETEGFTRSTPAPYTDKQGRATPAPSIDVSNCPKCGRRTSRKVEPDQWLCNECRWSWLVGSTSDTSDGGPTFGCPVCGARENEAHDAKAHGVKPKPEPANDVRDDGDWLALVEERHYKAMGSSYSYAEFVGPVTVKRLIDEVKRLRAGGSAVTADDMRVSAAYRQGWMDCRNGKPPMDPHLPANTEETDAR